MVFYKNKFFLILYGLSVFFIFLGWAFYFVKLGDFEHLLLIRYDTVTGIDFLGSKYYCLGMLGFGLFINCFNFFISWFFYQRERILSFLALFSSLFASSLIFIAILVIINSN